MKVTYGALQVPKPGASASQCEDAFAYSDTSGLAAVCDGASSAFASRLWAQLLAQGFVADSPLGLDYQGLVGWAESVAGRWSEAIPWQALNVFQEAKAREGSAATLVGLEVTPSQRQPTSGTWRCLALGDSCLFRVSDGALAEKLPVSRSADFSLSTPLLYTERDSIRQDLPGAVRGQGTWQQGDCFFLLTDAIAQWFLREDERGKAPWTTLMSLDEASFRAFVKEKQARREMRQDDVTAFMVGLGIPLATRLTPAPVRVEPPLGPTTEPAGPVRPGGPAQPTVPSAARPRGQLAAADGGRSDATGQGPDRDGTQPPRRWRPAVVLACVLALALVIAVATLVLGRSGASPAPVAPAVQTAAKDLADALTTFPGDGTSGYQAYQAKLASYVLNGNPAVVQQLTGSGSAPPSSFTSQTRGVTVAVVDSTESQADLYLVVDQAVTIGTRNVSRRLVVRLTMTKQGQRWLASGAQVQQVAGQATGALIPPGGTS